MSDLVLLPRNQGLGMYLKRGGLEQVHGASGDRSAWAITLLSQWQSAMGVVGDFVEIGVLHGRSFILLCLLRQPGERAAAIDVFSQQHLNPDNAGVGDREILEQNIEKHVGSFQDVFIHEVDSLTLAGKTVFAPVVRAQDPLERTIRIFSVDGSHTAQHTKNDILYATTVLVPKGIIVVDDFYNQGWPGVQEGVHDFLRERRDFAAVAYGDNKLYIVHEADHAMMLHVFREQLSEFAKTWKQQELHGKPCWLLSMGDVGANFDDLVARRPVLETSFGLGSEAIVELGEGWARGREASGTWMQAEKAVATLRLPPALLNPAPAGGELRVSVAPLLHQRRSQRRFRVSTDFGASFDGLLTRSTNVVLRVPGDRLAEPLTLTFFGDKPEAPADHVEGSQDRRPLSCRLTQLIISVDRPVT